MPQKTTKCLWHEASTLRQRQQNSAFNCTQWHNCSVRNLTIKDYSTFCTVEANYWRTRSIARPLCDSRATCTIGRCTYYSTCPSCSNTRTCSTVHRYKKNTFLPTPVYNVKTYHINMLKRYFYRDNDNASLTTNKSQNNTVQNKFKMSVLSKQRQ